MTLKEAAYWDEVGKVWKEDRPDPLWRVHSDTVNTALLNRWLPSVCVERLLKTDVFDEACSQGLFKILSAHANCVMGIDISTETLIAARDRHSAFRTTAADVRSLPFADDSFDVILSNSTLDHFPVTVDLETSLGELHRILRPGGELLLTMDNPVNPVVALRNALPFHWLNRIGVVPYYVGKTFGHRRLRRMLEAVGFEIVEVDAILHCPRVFAVALARLVSSGTPISRRFLSCLLAFERLSHLPTRFLTGHFTAIRAVKRAGRSSP
ncbi:MAG TPA: methyltransferase domain-containing protein [Tepidisphaeraceae bacterium]|nr:methyltransferase domain-containing protein [Tepidisphaeraceae bacterium]